MPAAMAVRSASPSRLLHEHDRRDDGARSGEQRRAERDERDVDVRHLRRVVLPVGEQLERDDEQQQPAGALQRRDADAEEVEDLLPDDGEQADDEQRDEHRLTGEPRAGAVGAAAGEAEEQRDAAQRVHDHEQRDEDGAEQRRVEPARRAQGCRTGSPVAAATSRSYAASLGRARAQLHGLGRAVEVAAAGGQQVELGRRGRSRCCRSSAAVVDVVDLEAAEPRRGHVDDDVVVDRAAAHRRARVGEDADAAGAGDHAHGVQHVDLGLVDPVAAVRCRSTRARRRRTRSRRGPARRAPARRAAARPCRRRSAARAPR